MHDKEMNTIRLHKSTCTWREGELSFLHRDGTLGWQGLAFSLTVDGLPFDSRQTVWRRIPSTPDRLVMVARPEALPLEVTVTVTATAAEDRLLVQCHYRNRSEQTLRLAGIVEGQGSVRCPQGRAFHIENIKQMFLSADKTPVPAGKRLAWGTVLCGQNYWEDLGTDRVYGRSEDQPYPAAFLVSPSAGMGLVDASFSEDRWYRETCLGAADGAGGFAYRSARTTRGVAAVKMPAGCCVDGEIAWLQITAHTELQRAFADYNDALLQKYDFRALTSPNREELIWGSWNLGIWDKCDDELIVGNARIIAENFPRVRWVQIDEGWAGHAWGGMGCPLYEGADAAKFPRGLGPVAADVKALGLRPALWCGMHIKEGARVLEDHPEWMLRNADGTPHKAGRHILDYSRQDVRDFLAGTYRRVIREWGYEGVKLDFWTYGFEDLDMVYQNDDRTSLELRNWWLQTLRGLLPEDGYLQPGCNLCSISPFVARWADNIRYGVDVGVGADWTAVTDSVGWLAALSVTSPGTMWIPNSDAIGSMKEMDPAKRRSWLSFCAVTGSALELGADLRKESAGDWQDAQRILADVQVGKAFRPLDFGGPEDPVPPALWFTEGGAADAENPAYAGMFCAFNWTGQGIGRPRVTFAEMGLPGNRYRAVNYWTGKEAACEGGIDLPAIAEHDVHALSLYRLG